MYWYAIEAVGILLGVRIWSRLSESRHLARIARLNREHGK